MKAGEKTFQELLTGQVQYVVPVFQRYYTWKRENWEKLWDDLDDIRHADRRHFLGTVVCVPENHQPGVIPAYLVIDGQQRLTTLSLLLSAMRDAAQNQDWKELAEEIAENYLIHRHKKNQERYKLYPRQRDRAAYLALVDASSKPADSQVVAAYEYFARRLRAEGIVENEKALREYFGVLATKLDFVAITLGRENPYKIFKSLNSTGEDLEEGDLIRNHVFMALPVGEQDQFDDTKWRPLEHHFDRSGKLDGRAFAAFFRDALMRTGAYIGKDGVYEAFEEAHPVGKLEPEKVVAGFTRQVENYDRIVGAAAHPVPGVDQALREIRDVQASTAYPLILALMDAHAAKKMDDAGLVKALKAISSFVLRRYVCGEGSRAYGRWFCSACRELGESPVQGLLAFLQAKGWPDDAKFIPAFQHMNLYGSKYDNAVLASLELSIQKKSEPVALHGCSIEHVLPQTIDPQEEEGAKWIEALGPDWRKIKGEWQDTPGNLTLVGDDYNKSMSNKAFEDKQPVLAGSKVYLNKHFGDAGLKVWNTEAITLRGQKLAELAAKVWAIST